MSTTNATSCDRLNADGRVLAASGWRGNIVTGFSDLCNTLTNKASQPPTIAVSCLQRIGNTCHDKGVVQISQGANDVARPLGVCLSSREILGRVGHVFIVDVR